MQSPKENLEQLTRIATAWANLRPEKAFAGLKLADFQTLLKGPRELRERIARLENELLAAQNLRNEADRAALAKAEFVVNAVKGDPAEGPDGELYEAMGYVRKSERKSGLRRSPKKEAAGKA